ncbi:MFS transporter [Candidatus Woesearchaeota archaeon]|nr:MFS transporter [Candidatus Woesearchaeota archaeon]
MPWNANQKTLLNNSALWAAYDGLTSTFISAFALALGASNLWIGILGAIPFVATALSQIPGAYSVQFVARKTIYLVMTGSSRLFWILILLAPFLFPHKALVFIALAYFIAKLLETFADPSWTTMLADIVPQHIRGRYVADRNILMGITGAAAYVAGGLLLDWFEKESIAGFAVIFGVGSIVGLATTLAMRNVKEPHIHTHEHYTVGEFFTMDPLFRRFCTFVFAFHFSWMIVSPFFTVYMLKNLGISYTYFVAMMAISTLAKIISHRKFGIIADRFGDKALMIIVTSAVALVPVMFYFVTPDTLWFLAPVHIFSGIAWAGFDIAMLNLMIDFSDGKKAPVRIAEAQMVSALAIIIAPIIGGFLADHIIWVVSGIPFLFLLGSMLRIVSLMFLVRLPEPRVTGAPSDIFHDIIGFRPVEGIIAGTRNVGRRLKAFMPR